MFKNHLLSLLVLSVSSTTHAQQSSSFVKKPWYETVSIRGYVQMRYNYGLTPNSNLTSEHDRSLGGNQGFLIRRARLVVSAQPSQRLFVYIQPDLASTPSSSSGQNVFQIRDLYADIFLTGSGLVRLRLGQSKVPFGFENLQSSQNRLTLDRSDAFVSAAKDERDLGAFVYWNTAETKQRFKMLVDNGLKGSGDYGMFALGVYNGQMANQPEQNRSLHAVTRITYPLQLSSGQIIETSVQAYSGRFVVRKDTKVDGANEFLDQRLGNSLIIYPQPLGLQVEYNQGQAPSYNPEKQTIELRKLSGGYVLASYKTDDLVYFAKKQNYHGGKKAETNSVHSYVDETELGVEWQIDSSLELTTSYMSSQRTDLKVPSNINKGEFLRLQMQWNY